MKSNVDLFELLIFISELDNWILDPVYTLDTADRHLLPEQMAKKIFFFVLPGSFLFFLFT